MSLPSYSDLADEIKTLKIEDNILKDKIKASKQSIKILVQRHDKFTWKKLKLMQNMRFYNGIVSVALFNKIFTLIKPYIPHTMCWKGPKHAIRIIKRTERKKMQTSLNHHDKFLLTLMQLRLGLLNEDIAYRFDISPTKCSFIFTTWIKLLTNLLKNLVPWLPRETI